jgi:AraC family transcriptional regulator of adaptative response / DNA-3-methyladenine glycosylase II
MPRPPERPARPSGRRRQVPEPSLHTAPPAWRLRLRLPVPYDLDWVLAFLATRAAPALERVSPGELLRVVRLDDGAPLLLRVRPQPASAAAPAGWLSVLATAAPAVTPLLGATAAATAGDAARTPATGRAALRRLLCRMFDLDTDLAPFLALARRDPVLAPLVARHPGLRLPQLPDPLEGAVRAIVGQQVSVAGARTVVDRIVRRFGDPVAASGLEGLFAFPRAAALAAAAPEHLTALGLTRAKAAALLAVAAATRDGAIDWERLRSLPADDAQAALQALRGIGPWTASYIRMRALADPDAFPAADLGLLKALAACETGARDAGSASTTGGVRTARNARGTPSTHRTPGTPGAPGPPRNNAGRPLLPTAATTALLADAWRPFRAYAAIHLWRSLSP